MFSSCVQLTFVFRILVFACAYFLVCDTFASVNSVAGVTSCISDCTRLLQDAGGVSALLSCTGIVVLKHASTHMYLCILNFYTKIAKFIVHSACFRAACNSHLCSELLCLHAHVFWFATRLRPSTERASTYI